MNSKRNKSQFNPDLAVQIIKNLQNQSLIMKKVLIITYYWPPSGGAGVQRWVKFVKYLE